jgi:hypothetical protein
MTEQQSRDESRDLYLDTHMICSGRESIERYPVADKADHFGGVDVSHYVPAEHLDAMQARAIAAEVRAEEYRVHGEVVKRELQATLQRQDERFRAQSSKLTVAEYRIAELQPAADLARKIGLARANASPELWSLLDQAAALARKATA